MLYKQGGIVPCTKTQPKESHIFTTIFNVVLWIGFIVAVVAVTILGINVWNAFYTALTNIF